MIAQRRIGPRERRPDSLLALASGISLRLLEVDCKNISTFERERHASMTYVDRLFFMSSQVLLRIRCKKSTRCNVCFPAPSSTVEQVSVTFAAKSRSDWYSERESGAMSWIVFAFRTCATAFSL